MPSPPKPWETRGPAGASSGNFPPSSSSMPNSSSSNPFSGSSSSSTFPPSSSGTSGTPPIPSRPDASPSSFGAPGTYNTGLGSSLPTGSGMGLGMGGMGSSYGSTGYGGYGSSYGSGYGSSYGSGYGSSMYGGGYGSSMMGGGYGSSMYGGGGYGSSMMGGGYGMGYNRFSPHSRYGMAGGRMGEDPSLASQMQMSTQSTFQLLERFVGTFGGIAQMMESTYFATHSSFMAMVGVADQFGSLKNSLAQVFSVYAIYRYVRNSLYRLMGKRVPVDPNEINPNEFKQFAEKPKYSYRPFLMFICLVFGVPYLLHLYMKSVARKLAKQQQERLANQLAISGSNQTFEFAQATYDFKGSNSNELNFIKGDLIAILSKGFSAQPSDPSSPQWWQGRLRDGTVGMFPSNYVEILEKKVDLSQGPPGLNSNPSQFNPMGLSIMPSNSMGSNMIQPNQMGSNMVQPNQMNAQMMQSNQMNAQMAHSNQMAQFNQMGSSNATSSSFMPSNSTNSSFIPPNPTNSNNSSHSIHVSSTPIQSNPSLPPTS